MEHKTSGSSSLRQQDYWVVWGILLYSATIASLSFAKTILGFEGVTRLLPGVVNAMHYFCIVGLGFYLLKREVRGLWHAAFCQAMSVVLTHWKLFQHPEFFQTDLGTLRLVLGSVIPIGATWLLFQMARRLSQKPTGSRQSRR